MTYGDTAPVNPLTSRDAYVIAGLLAALRGAVTTETSELLVTRIRERFVSATLLPQGAGSASVAAAVADLERRFRFALGEYGERPWQEQS